MKRFLLSVLAICLLSVVGAYLTYRVVGVPDRAVECDPDLLPEHHVCLETVREWPADDVLWVDARPRAEWERNGVEGSVLVNDQEDWLELEFDFLGRMTESLRARVVVYCNQSGCGSSKYVADRLRERHAGTFGFQVWVLEGGAKALAAEARGNGSP